MQAEKNQSLSQNIFNTVDLFLQRNEEDDPSFSYEQMQTIATYQKSVKNDTQVSREYTQYDLVVPDIWEFLSIFQNPKILGSITKVQQYFQHFSPTLPKPKMFEGVTVIQKSPHALVGDFSYCMTTDSRTHSCSSRTFLRFGRYSY